jgi:N-carbamoyl-L-amino-acid hydrolase
MIALRPQRAIDDLRELQRRTADAGGARRVAWTPDWLEARALLRERLDALGLAPEQDEAGNLWTYLPGESDEIVALGSHLDAVPGGGWLDGALGVMAGLELLRAYVEAGAAPRRTLALVDFADEEGSRFGRSLLGSSAVSGTLDAAAEAGLTDAEGRRLDAVLAGYGVDLGEALRAAARRERLVAYLELHIEQGPVLEQRGVAAAAVSGTTGIERHTVTIRGRQGHAGATPMALRRDPMMAAAEALVGIERAALEAGGMATVGLLKADPGIVTAVPGVVELGLDVRHADADRLAALLAAATAEIRRAAARRGCEAEVQPHWSVPPTRFDARLVELARAACAQAGGDDELVISGPGHDAVEMARVVPTAMVFAPSRGGLSHTVDEDTSEADLRIAIEAFALLAQEVLGGE